jgi:lipid II:glycine glycyltransferase (peptidoglycan interpeptide bridge formation enzyme)
MTNKINIKNNPFFMQIKFIKDEQYKTEWNKVVSHPLQTWEWGSAKEKSGTKVIRVAVFENGKITQAYLFTLHSLPLGKLVVNYARGTFVPPAVLSELVTHYKNKGLVFIKLEPNVYKNESGMYKVPLIKKSWFSNGLKYVRSNTTLFAPHTFLIDLSFSEDKLLSFMKSKTRYNIRLAQKKGVKIADETNSKKGFDTFFNLYQQTIKRQNYLGHNYDYHFNVWQELKKSGMVKILIAYYQDLPLSAYQLFFFKKGAYYLYGGSSHLHKDVMASNLLMWHAIETAASEGAETFDMWGALNKNYNPSDPWAGFHRFKEGYGGVHKSYLPTLDVVVNTSWYLAFNLIWPLRKKILELLEKIK